MKKLVNNFDEYIILDFVGRPGVNTWNNRIKPQIILKDLKKTKIEKEEPKILKPEDLVF